MKAEAEPRQTRNEALSAEQLARYWPLDPNITFLNHGGFGVCPWPVLHAQSEWRARMEREPVRFLDQELDGLLAVARARLGEFVGADPDDLAFVPNATTGINTVLKSLAFEPGDEILATDHEYNASLNTIANVAAQTGAIPVVAHVPFPVESPDQVVDAILGRASPRTRLAVISHVTSPTAVVFPIERLVGELASRGIDTLVDGAHAPGMLPSISMRSAPRTSPATPTSGWPLRKAPASSMFVATGRKSSIRWLLLMARTSSAPVARDSAWSSTGPARPIPPPISPLPPGSTFWARYCRVAGRS